MSNNEIISKNITWAERVVESTIYLRGESLSYKKSPKGKWDYTTGLVLHGILKVWEKTKKQKYYDYVKTTMDSFINPDGTINNYSQYEYNIDHINMGKVLFTLLKITGEEKYKKALELLRSQLKSHPRTKEGGFWHKHIYPHQMWLDGIFMGSPFYCEYAHTFNEKESFDDVAKQIIIIEKRTRDPKSGLLYHAYDESRGMKWSDDKTGCSPHFWGRAMGWYVVGIVDVLDFMPADHKDRAELIEILKRTLKVVSKYQDKSGLWYQILDKKNKRKNYLEASCSCMFVYGIAKGVRKGYLPEKYLENAKKGFEGLEKRVLEVEASGIVNVTKICQVAGLGGNPYRNGSFKYYMSEPVVANDRKGVGAFIHAAYEMELAKK